MLGQIGLAWYVGKTASQSTYGAAGSLIAVLLWVYWTSQILFFGAEFTQVWANKFGSRIEPVANAIPVTAEDRARQGMAAADGTARNICGKGASPPPSNRSLEPHAAYVPQRTRRPSTVDDLGTVLAGFGIVLVLSRFLRRD
jgi:hypothetical protein